MTLLPAIDTGTTATTGVDVHTHPCRHYGLSTTLMVVLG